MKKLPCRWKHSRAFLFSMYMVYEVQYFVIKYIGHLCERKTDVVRRKKWFKLWKTEEENQFAVVKEVLSWTVEIALTLLIAFTFVYFIGLRTSVVGQSMSKTLNGGDQILVNRFVYKVTDPKTDDIVVFLPNGNEKSHYYVKRVIGCPGDTVQIKNGTVYVNGKAFDEETDVASIEDAGLAAGKRSLGSEEYFVLGDNRNNSEDSRYANIGNIKKDYIIGKAWFRVAPFSEIGFL